MRSFLCMRRAQQCRARRQSAAVLPSHAPHDSKARLQLVTTRRDSWRSHVHRTYTPQAAQSFKPQTANVRGRGGRPLVLSLGGYKGGYSLSRKRVSPFYALPHGTGTILLHRCRKKLFYASGVRTPFSVTSIVQRISCSSTGTSGDMSCSRQMSTVGQWSCGSRRS